MRVLYISDRQDGGILQHVRCLRASLPSEVESYEIGHGGTEEFVGRNGHDIREWIQIRRVMRDFKPDIVHFHIPALMMVLYVRFFTKAKIVRSWHTPTTGGEGFRRRIVRWLFGSKCYYLPVSGSTWDGLRRWAPRIKGEVLFNPIRVDGRSCPNLPSGWKATGPVVGMVGRNAEQKDWPSFHEVERLVKESMPEVAFLNGGEKGPCDGRKTILGLDLFVMTSKHEELPTTMLECFLLGTPICGFIPEGGVSDILNFSSGAVRDAFIDDRNCDKLAELVLELLSDGERRRRMVKDGWQILVNHFSADRLVKDQLMATYRKAIS